MRALRWLATAIAVFVVLQPVCAQTYSVGGYTWDVVNGVRRVLPVDPPGISGFNFYDSEFLKDTDFDRTKTLGWLMSGTSPSGNPRFVELGNSITRKIILVDWEGMRLPNAPGEDLVVYEVGSVGAPEGFMIAVRKKGSTEFSPWRYEFANTFTAGYLVFATAFNLDDFGLAEGESIDAILIANLIEADRVDSPSGQGNVILGGGSGFVPVQGPLSDTPNQPYQVTRFDADIVYVGVLHDILPPGFSISGTVTLGDFVGDVTQIPVDVELRQGGSVVRSESVNLDSTGGYVLTDVEPGDYDIAFKASHWLRVVTQVTVSSTDVSGVDVVLTNGDIDGDNEVTLFDFGALVAAFGSMPGDSNWNPSADLDGDEEVTLFDFGVLVRNFGAIGDE
ncbi:MAG: hypothetical protein HPY54_13055 [Chthonomonadetes bacterium]|nr:hypothetical protein [Chthonomonadetes bacterium]